MLAYPMRNVQKSELPTQLWEIPDAPTSLYVRGTLPDPSFRYLCVVGAREYTPYGRQACERIIRGLAGYPVVIVSGLALGIDGIAHAAALESQLPTIAVPGSGLHDTVLYPATHRPLAHKILEQNGALLSEFPERWRPRKESFPQRNRVMAGMSHAVLVVEATRASGTLITARLAADYNRDVGAVPGPVHAITSAGPHALLKNGAALIETAEDVLLMLNIAPSTQKLDFAESTSFTSVQQTLLSELVQPRTRDELLEALRWPVATLNEAIASLELRGIIRERGGAVERLR